MDVLAILGAPVLGFLEAIGPWFQKPAFAPALSILMIVFAFALGTSTWLKAKIGARAADRRIKVIDRAIAGAPDREAAQAAFAANYAEISLALGEKTRGTGLERAWQEFHETIIDETETPIRNTARPFGYFNRALPTPKNLTFWSNTAVGAGLVLTFLGVVVALRETSGSFGASAEATQDALKKLIEITAFKFTTSVAGVLSSLILRFYERAVTHGQDRAIGQLCDRLERGMRYVSPQALAASQLAEVKRQTAQLEKFNTDLALKIGDSIADKFESALQPVTASLGAIQGQMSEIQSQSLGAISDQLGKTMETAASGELRALGSTLGALRQDLDTMGSTIKGGGSAAASQIEAAGATFAQAASDIRSAFAELAAKVDGMGERLTAESDTVSRQMTERVDAMMRGFETSATANAEAVRSAVAALQTAGAAAAGAMQTSLGEAFAASGEAARTEIERASAGMRDAFGDISARLSAVSERMTVESDSAAQRMAARIEATMTACDQSTARSAAALDSAVEALSAAGSVVATRFQTAISDSLSASSRAAEEEIRNAAQRLGQSLAGAANEIERLQGAFSLIERAVGGHADSLKSSAESSRTAAVALGDASRGIATAAQPVATASAALARAAESTTAAGEAIVRSSQSFTGASQSALASVQIIADNLARTQDALRAAWEAHRTQFQNVDAELGKAVGTLASAVADNGTNLSAFVRNTDEAMLRVIDRLQVLLDPITDYTDRLDAYTKALMARRDGA